MFVVSSLLLNLFIGLVGTGLIIALYLLLTIKQKYISTIANSLQIPSFNRLIKLTKNARDEGSLDISDISYRNAFKPFNAYIVLYLSYKKSDKIDDFIEFSEKIPKQLKYQLAKSLQNPYTQLANKIYNTDKIKAQRPKEIAGKKIEDPDHSMVGVSLSAIAQSPGREAALCRASLPKACPASSVRAREGAGCGSVGAVSGA